VGTRKRGRPALAPTKSRGLRLPLSTWLVIERRARQLGQPISDYLQIIIEREVIRSHH